MGLSADLTGLGRPVAAAAALLVALAAPAIAQPPAPVDPGPPPGTPAGPAPVAAPGPAVPPPADAPLPVPLTNAAPVGCPDVQVVFARGTTEAPGLGAMGQAFVDDLQAKVGPKSVGVYPVNYPASPDFPTAVQGVTDASNFIQQTAANCPKTKMVLGGYSQGAAVMGFVTSSKVPDGVAPTDVPPVMPPDVAKHVAAVALMGTPSDRFMGVIKQPSVQIGTLYEPKTLELCVPEDFVCSAGNDLGAHARYISDGLVNQAADFAATKVAETPGAKPAAPKPAAPTPAPLAAPAAPAPAAPAPVPPPAAPAPAPAPAPVVPAPGPAPVVPPAPGPAPGPVPPAPAA